MCQIHSIDDDDDVDEQDKEIRIEECFDVAEQPVKFWRLVDGTLTGYSEDGCTALVRDAYGDVHACDISNIVYIYHCGVVSNH